MAYVRAARHGKPPISPCTICSCPKRAPSGYLVKDLPDRPLFHFPQFSLLAHGVAAVTMGIARASIRELVRTAAEKKRYGTSVTLANRAHSQIEVAAAEARLRSARAFFYETIETAWSLALEGVPAVAPGAS